MRSLSPLLRNVLVTLLAASTMLAPVPIRGETPATNAKEEWHGRLTAVAAALLADPQTQQHTRFLVIPLTCSTLAKAGYTEQAIRLATDGTSPAEKRGALQFIAAAQSEIDDVDGALRTVELLDDGGQKQRALQLVVARQAQRGDFADAVELLDRISDLSLRDQALTLVIASHLKSNDFQQASQLVQRASDPEARQRLREEIEHARNRPTPDDPDYVNRVVAEARETRSLVGFGEHQAETLREAGRARVAIHYNDAAAFNKAMEALHRLAEECTGIARRNSLIQIGFFYQRFGDEDSARRAYEEAFESIGVTGNPFDMMRIGLSTSELLQMIVQVVPTEKLRQWVEKLAATGDAGDLMGGIASATAARGNLQLAEHTYQSCRTTEQRLWVAGAVLEALAGCVKSSY